VFWSTGQVSRTFAPCPNEAPIELGPDNLDDVGSKEGQPRWGSGRRSDRPHETVCGHRRGRHVTFPSRSGRITASSARTAPGRPRRCASCSGCSTNVRVKRGGWPPLPRTRSNAATRRCRLESDDFTPPRPARTTSGDRRAASIPGERVADVLDLVGLGRPLAGTRQVVLVGDCVSASVSPERCWASRRCSCSTGRGPPPQWGGTFSNFPPPPGPGGANRPKIGASPGGKRRWGAARLRRRRRNRVVSSHSIAEVAQNRRPNPDHRRRASPRESPLAELRDRRTIARKTPTRHHEPVPAMNPQFSIGAPRSCGPRAPRWACSAAWLRGPRCWRQRFTAWDCQRIG